MASIRTRSSSITINRRRLLQLGAGSLAAFSWTGLPQLQAASKEFRCIFLHLVGGPSHLDTWDPKPDAPAEYRGPFRAIKTNVPGIAISELFPQMARMADQFALVRSVYHDEAPIHETGQQLIQTGNCNAAQKTSAIARRPAQLLIPGIINNTGVQLSHGQDHLSPCGASAFHSLERESTGMREAYGQHEFGQSCLLARQAIERGQQFVTVNMFRTVYDSLSWDCHADGGSLNTNLMDYRSRLAPMFDTTYTTLLKDLKARGLLETTLVVAAGEFGRSPKINLRGGRDHWTGAWTVLFAGGGVQGGQVIGSTDQHGMAPSTHPVHASSIANTIQHVAGLRTEVQYRHGEPLTELFKSARPVA